MSDDEDDYLSDKFLLGGSSSSSAAASSKPKTYSELRKQAIRASEAKQAAGRKKSHRTIVEEGLSTSLFEKAKEQEAAGMGKNKALGMMMKMGFKPGQSLGRAEGLPTSEASTLANNSTAKHDRDTSAAPEPTTVSTNDEAGSSSGHRLEPIAINFWEGRAGIGQKRPNASKANPYAPSAKKPRTSATSEAKEKESAEAFRERTRREYEEKRAEARLIVATRTCVTLDEQKGGLKFNILWLNPMNPNTCPPELLEAFARDAAVDINGDDIVNSLDPTLEPLSQPLDEYEEPLPTRSRRERGVQASDADNLSHAARLRDQMRRDALQPSSDDIDDDVGGIRPFGSRSAKHHSDDEGDRDTETETLSFSTEQVAEAREFLNLPAKDRLERVLRHLREQYYYCFWCGTQYEGKEDMEGSCPGEDEEAHD